MDLILDESRERLLGAQTHALVTGGPGCGKTTIALAKAEKRIVAGLAGGQCVLFLSFSRAAVGRILEASKLQLPKELRGCLSIHTFHSFFWEILRAYAYLLGAPRSLHLLLPHDERVLRDGAEGEDASWNAERERLFFGKGLVAFDLFAPKANELLQKSRRIRDLFTSRYPLIIVDEAQDTAEDQWQAVKILGSVSQLVCLADLDQQIYDFRPGVTAERLTQIMEALAPMWVDLAKENHRSPGSEIVTFGNDVLLGTPRGKPYKGVTRLNFSPAKAGRDSAIRKSIGIVSKQVRKSTGEGPKSIAVLATWGRGVGVITRALTGNGTTDLIPHRVVIDEAPVLLASRLVAFLLEPKRDGKSALLDLAEGLELAGAVYRSKGSKTSLVQAVRLSAQTTAARSGQTPKANAAGHAFLALINDLHTHVFSGDPRKDWITVRNKLRDIGNGVCSEIAAYSEQLIAFQRGQRIASELTRLWQSQGTYRGAREALDAALAQEQLFAGGDDLQGIHVMTVHKSKAKEFDAVVIFDDPKSSPLVYCKESAPFRRSRRLLRVGITRARHQVLVLSDVSDPSTLLVGHNL